MTTKKIKSEECKYVKDAEGYAVLLPVSEIQPGHVIINEEEYNAITGYIEVVKKYGHGGKRPGAGRKKQYPERVTVTRKISKNIAELVKKYSREKKISENQAMEELIKAGLHFVNEDKAS